MSKEFVLTIINTKDGTTQEFGLPIVEGDGDGFLSAVLVKSDGERVPLPIREKRDGGSKP